MRRALAAVTFALPLLAALAAGCRDDDLCVKTLQATCICDDPLQPSLSSCTAYADVVSCAAGATVDPCKVNPCCRLAGSDGGTDAATSVRDLSSAPTDSTMSDDLGDAGASGVDASAPSDAAPSDLAATSG